MHREIDDQKITDNRKVSTRTCKWGWRNRQAEIVGKSCDEFPFASTKEGALSGTHYSVDYISHPDNQGFGFYVLGPFYQKERIIENDNFYVQVVED
ncbi:NucA/NucB deoxyribonuclease domain-containing protein [Acrocarpospora sp. B8E8]|uniref:NucA/NucB deoxyribonuclease domain-containing protein n=1 Tax=Acrocarpospora sp. B8E8 TaxID=3153572 RepID=UPI00325E555D